MDTDRSPQEAAQWKKKYLDQLEESERHEKQWQEADELLRKTVSRLTLAADGIDKSLDRQLRDLRNAIRDHASTAQLRSLVDDMSRTLVKLDNARQQRKHKSEDRPLLDLLESLALPKSSNRQAKALKKQLGVADGGDSKEAVKAFAELLRDALRQTSGGTTGEPESGLLSRLFKSAETKRSAAPQPETNTQPAHDADEPDVAAAPDIASDLQRGNEQSVREILIQLLDRLSLPEELIDDVGAIREHIAGMAEGDSWDEVLEQIADLILAIRVQTQNEKQGITNFLEQLTERLQEVDRQLQGSEQYYDASVEAGEKLDSAVKMEMAGIETGVRDADNLESLKQVVQKHIDSVLGHMQNHRDTEEQRYQQAKLEIARMGGRLKDMEQETDSLRSRLREERNQAMIDALTGIPNRLAYEERLEQEIARWKRFGTPLVLVVWDVDLFKRVNDSFGHKAGDKVLRTIAQVLAKGVRETDFVARYGGEEFVQLMTGSALADCLRVVEKMRSAVEATGFHFRKQAVTVTVSGGLAEFSDGDSIEQCFERADQALYKAKQQGRNRCEIAG